MGPNVLEEEGNPAAPAETRTPYRPSSRYRLTVDVMMKHPLVMTLYLFGLCAPTRNGTSPDIKQEVFFSKI